MRLKTKIIHSFEIEDDLMEDMDFTISIPTKDIKKKAEIIIEKRKSKIKADASTRLF